MIDALVSGLEIVQRFVSCDVMRRSSAVEEKKGFFSASAAAAVIIVHLQTEVRRVYGDLHAAPRRGGLRHTKVVQGEKYNSASHHMYLIYR